MSKMKDLVFEILEMYNDEHLSISEIARSVGFSVDEVQAVVNEWSIVDQNGYLGQ
jgi:predicted transcriptional regulator